MVVENINDALGVVLARVLQVANDRLDEVAEVTETSLQPSIGVAEPLLHCVDDVLLPQLVLVAHTVDVLLGGAATVLQLLDDVEVSEVRCVDYSLCAETNLAAYILDCCLDAANGRLQRIEVAIQVSRQSLQVLVVALDCSHQQVAVVVVAHLIAKAVNLRLDFGTLYVAVLSVPAITVHESEHSQHHHVGEWVVPTSTHTTVHCCQHSRWIIVSTSSEQGCC